MIMKSLNFVLAKVHSTQLIIYVKLGKREKILCTFDLNFVIFLFVSYTLCNAVCVYVCQCLMSPCGLGTTSAWHFNKNKHISYHIISYDMMYFHLFVLKSVILLSLTCIWLEVTVLNILNSFNYKVEKKVFQWTGAASHASNCPSDWLWLTVTHTPDSRGTLACRDGNGWRWRDDMTSPCVSFIVN